MSNTEMTSLEEQAEQLKQDGNDCYKQHNFSDAVDLYSRALELAPSANLYGNRAAAYLGLQLYDKAADDCRTAIELNPKFVKAHLRLGKCCLSSGDIAGAKKSLIAARTYEPNNTSATEELALCSRLEKVPELVTAAKTRQEWSRAKMLLEQTLENAPSWRNMRLEYARVLIATENYDACTKECVKLMKLDSDDVEAMELRGEVLYLTNHMDSAIKHFQQALVRDPDHRRAQVMLKRAKLLERLRTEGNQMFQQGRSSAAVEKYTEAMEVDPTHKQLLSILHANRAAALVKLGKHKEAEDDCTAAININKEYSKAYMRRGQCRIALGLYQDAVQDMHEAHTLDPNSEEIKNLLRQAQLELKKSKRKDLYKTLDISRDASDDDIKKAYKRQALLWHPDKHNGSEEERAAAEVRFKDINEAYAILSDSTKRSRYDSGVEIEDLDSRGGFGGGEDPSDIFSAFFGGGGGARGFGGHGFGDAHGGYGGYEEPEYHEPPRRSMPKSSRARYNSHRF